MRCIVHSGYFEFKYNKIIRSKGNYVVVMVVVMVVVVVVVVVMVVVVVVMLVVAVVVVVMVLVYNGPCPHSAQESRYLRLNPSAGACLIRDPYLACISRDNLIPTPPQDCLTMLCP